MNLCKLSREKSSYALHRRSRAHSYKGTLPSNVSEGSFRSLLLWPSRLFGYLGPQDRGLVGGVGFTTSLSPLLFKSPAIKGGSKVNENVSLYT